MKKNIEILLDSKTLKHWTEFLAFNRNIFLNQKIIWPLVQMENIEIISVQKAAVAILNQMIQMLRNYLLCRTNILYTQAHLVISSYQLSPSRIDHTGKSGFIAIKAPAFE